MVSVMVIFESGWDARLARFGDCRVGGAFLLAAGL